MIRYQRVGRRNDASFRIVVTEHTRGPKSGDSVELVGSYNPKTKAISLKKERIEYWMSVGARLSDSVHNLLVKEGVIEGKKINVLPKKSPIVKEEESSEKEESADEGSAEEAPAAETKEEVVEEAPKEEVAETKEEVAEETKEEVSAPEETKKEEE